MPFSVQLENPQPVYHGGEELRGKVVFDCSDETFIGDVRIVFAGGAKTKIRKIKTAGVPRATYRGRAALFELDRLLLNGGCTLGQETYEWPFHFVFPVRVQQLSQPSRWARKAPFDCQPFHPLPPTFTAALRNQSQEAECFIQYRIEAEICKPRALFSGSEALFSDAVLLKYMPAATCATADHYTSSQKSFSVRSLLLLPENRGRSLTIREKSRSLFSPNQVPVFHFRTTFSHPVDVPQNARFSCILDVDPIMEDSTCSSVPPVKLRKVSLYLSAKTAARTSAPFLGAPAAEVDEKITLISESSLDLAVMGRVDLSEVGGASVMGRHDPTFSTYSISRSYGLNASFHFECAGKTLVFELRDLFVQVLPEFDTTSPSPEAKREEAGREGLQAADEELPPYELTSASTATEQKS